MERYCTKCGKITVKQNKNLYTCAVGHENWINPVSGATVFVIKENEVLFGVRSSDPSKGKLDVPGGFIEVFETAEQAAVREAKEEFGIDITLERCLGTYTSSYEDRPALNIVFVASMADQNQKVVPSDDMSGGELVWRDIENLPVSGEIVGDWMIAAQCDVVTWWRQNH